MTGIIGNPGIKTKNPNTEMIKMTGDIHQRKEKHLITGALAEIKTETKAEAISHKDLLDMIVETKNIKGEIQVIMVELTKKDPYRRSLSNKTPDRNKNRNQSPRNTNCLRCGGSHLSSSCKKYDFYSGKPCDRCDYLHSTDSHKSSREKSIDKKGRNEYSIPDHRYRDPPDGIFSTTVVKSEGENENIFRNEKN